MDAVLFLVFQFQSMFCKQIQIATVIMSISFTFELVYNCSRIRNYCLNFFLADYFSIICITDDQYGQGLPKFLRMAIKFMFLNLQSVLAVMYQLLLSISSIVWPAGRQFNLSKPDFLIFYHLNTGRFIQFYKKKTFDLWNQFWPKGFNRFRFNHAETLCLLKCEN